MVLIPFDCIWNSYITSANRYGVRQVKLVAIDSCIVQGQTDLVHYALFHGDEERADRPYPNSAAHYFGDDLINPIQIMIGGTPLREVILPGNSLVVSSDVSNAISNLPNLILCPVEFVHTVRFTYIDGDFSPPRHQLNLTSSYSFLRSLPNDPTLLPLHPYYEVVVTNSWKTHSHSEAFYRTIYLPNLVVPKVELCLRTTILDTCPIFWSSAVIMQQSIFDGLYHHFHPHYFTWTEFTV